MIFKVILVLPELMWPPYVAQQTYFTTERNLAYKREMLSGFMNLYCIFNTPKKCQLWNWDLTL